MHNLNKSSLNQHLSFNKIKDFFVGVNSPQEDQPDKTVSTLMFSSFGLHHISPRRINQVLMIISGVLFLTVVYSGLNNRLNVEDMMKVVSKIPFQNASRKGIEPFQAIEFYQEMVNRRDIFSPFMSAQKEKIIVKPKVVEQKIEIPEIQLSDLAKDLKVVGISWGNLPKALIHSEKDNDTYFVRQGQRIGSSDIKIKKIEQKAVIIMYEDQEMELW